MYRITIEKIYMVKKGNKKFVVELCRTNDGKLFVIPIFTTKHIYETTDGEEKEWNYDITKAEEVDYISLPQNIREALSKLHVI